jgi:hypothetical protein
MEMEGPLCSFSIRAPPSSPLLLSVSIRLRRSSSVLIRGRSSRSARGSCGAWGVSTWAGVFGSGLLPRAFPAPPTASPLLPRGHALELGVGAYADSGRCPARAPPLGFGWGRRPPAAINASRVICAASTANSAWPESDWRRQGTFAGFRAAATETCIQTHASHINTFWHFDCMEKVLVIGHTTSILSDRIKTN